MNKLAFVRDSIQSTPGLNERPKKGAALKYFFTRAAHAAKLVFTEKEILVFAIFQWAAIGFGYFLWVQMLDWIPEEVWRSAENSDSGSPADLVLLAWSFMIVGIVSLPVGIFTACIGAVHLLRCQNRPSTIASCLQIVAPRAYSLWAFSWADSWVTVHQILNRLPKKRGNGNSALEESLYYAWKLGTIGVLPALLSGRGLIDAGKDSVLLVKNKIAETSLLRAGYSAICWVLGAATYVGAILFLVFFSNPPADGSSRIGMHEFYFLMGFPILISAGIILLLLRPIYTIASVDIYSDYLRETNQSLLLPTPPSELTSAVVSMLVLLAIVCSVFFFRDQLGITDMLSVPYRQE